MICVNDKRSNLLLKEGMIYNVKIVAYSPFKEGFGIKIEGLGLRHNTPFYLSRFKPCMLQLSINIKIL